MAVSAVSKKDLGRIWFKFEDKIRKGLKRGAGYTVSEAEIKLALERRQMVMWAIHEKDKIKAIAIIEGIQYAKFKSVMVVLIAGESFHEWVGTLENLLLRLKKQMGADMLEATCRPGVARWLSKRGWRNRAIMMEKT